METIIIEEIKQINPRSRSGRKKIIGKTTADGKPEDPEYFKNTTNKILNNLLIVMVADV